MQRHYHAIYDGPVKRLKLKSALLLVDGAACKAQFDDLSQSESHGWHEFPESDFVNKRKMNVELG